MEPEYDLSKMKSLRNPFFSQLKQELTLKLSDDNQRQVTLDKSLLEQEKVPVEVEASLTFQFHESRIF